MFFGRLAQPHERGKYQGVEVSATGRRNPKLRPAADRTVALREVATLPRVSTVRTAEPWVAGGRRGQRLPESPQAVLVLPGWYVVPKGLGPVLVANYKAVLGAITRGHRVSLPRNKWISSLASLITYVVTWRTSIRARRGPARARRSI